MLISLAKTLREKAKESPTSPIGVKHTRVGTPVDRDAAACISPSKSALDFEEFPNNEHELSAALDDFTWIAQREKAKNDNFEQFLLEALQNS